MDPPRKRCTGDGKGDPRHHPTALAIARFLHGSVRMDPSSKVLFLDFVSISKIGMAGQTPSLPFPFGSTWVGFPWDWDVPPVSPSFYSPIERKGKGQIEEPNAIEGRRTRDGVVRIPRGGMRTPAHRRRIGWDRRREGAACDRPGCEARPSGIGGSDRCVETSSHGKRKKESTTPRRCITTTNTAIGTKETWSREDDGRNRRMADLLDEWTQGWES